MKLIFQILSIFSSALLFSCSSWQNPQKQAHKQPSIFPDYIGVEIPKNIAPLNFEVAEAKIIQATFTAADKQVRLRGERYIDIPLDDWTELKQAALRDKSRRIQVKVEIWSEQEPQGIGYEPFDLTVSADEIDPYISYRLIPPAYELWSSMGIYERDLSSFDEEAIVTNEQNNRGCVNCHSYANYDPQQGMMFHARGKGGGTVLYKDGKLQKVPLELMGPQRSGTYPMWHPKGRFIVFSSNLTRQSFYAHSQDKIEVYDLRSDLIVYDTQQGEVLSDERFLDSLSWETFPAFSPKGDYLYFCTAKPQKMPSDYAKLRYSICRVSFNSETGQLGTQIDTIYSASRQGGSASFPRLSPDGRYLLFTLATCATFPIHHKEADLKLIDLKDNNKLIDAKELNSDDVDSYHSWGSTGNWVILSSKRIDGRYTRLFIAHWDGKKFSKPFLLPQRDPCHNKERLYSYNIPEFMKAPIHFDRDELGKLFSADSK